MKLTLTSNHEQPVIRVVGEHGDIIRFTAEDLRQLNEFAATCPEFKELPVRFKAGDVVNHKTVVAFFVEGGFWRTSFLVLASPRS